jgi:hypothetical protein
MKPEFSKYSLEQLLEEKSFIEWVLLGTHNSEWEKFLDDHPEIYLQVKNAREIILLLQDDYELMDEVSVLELWKSIDSFNNLHKQKIKKFTIRRRLSWAASVLLIVSLGTFGFLYFNDSWQNYRFASSEITESDESRMMLSNGEEIALKKDNSTIAMDEVAEQVIVNDSIIDLSKKMDAGKPEAKMNEVVIPYGKKSELLLADGTKVWLNAGSRLAFPTKFTGKKREIFLEGEACFQVAHNSEKPFVVNAGGLDIKVLGTNFNVSAYPTEKTVETVLVEGSVAVSRSKAIKLGKNETILKPNQKASFDKENNEVTLTDEPDVDLYIAWTYGWLRYERESLESVLRKVERYYNVEIELPADYPRDDKISGKLDLENSLATVMGFLSDASGFNYRIAGNKVLIDERLDKLPTR